jgi:hypothetical protein
MLPHLMFPLVRNGKTIDEEDSEKVPQEIKDSMSPLKAPHPDPEIRKLVLDIITQL